MAELSTDRDLLREYAKGGSEDAFRVLVERHVNLVFNTAFRGLNDTHTTQEITQNVFVLLARKAAGLSGDVSVAGWLHKTTVFEVRRWWRGELRRQRREQAAIELGTTMKDEDSLLKDLTGELDQGLLALRDSDRQALILRYFEGRTHREIGVLLGAREDAVRMRISKALDYLTRFFRGRGYAVPAAATTIAVLSQTAKGVPAGLAISTANAALAAGSGATVGGVKLLFIKVMGFSKTQTAAVCLVIAALPVAWEWNANRRATTRWSATRASLESVVTHQAQASAEIDRLNAETGRLDGALADAARTKIRYEDASAKLDKLRALAHELLSSTTNEWPSDLAYVRVPKSVVKSLDLLNHTPTAFHQSGALTDAALELFGITADEKEPAEKALAGYWQGVYELMAAAAYETNSAGEKSDQYTKTVVVPPLGASLKTLAEETGTKLTNLLGGDREKLLFGGWDEGGIQIFWPGNLWKISEEPQTFTLRVEPSGAGDDKPGYRSTWASSQGSTSGAGRHNFRIFPSAIARQFFDPWLIQFGINASSADE
jgi:RNA polymerase sigma factor (sigma-70 family)